MILPSSKHTAFFSATCLAMGFMVSPLSMPVVGNSAGVLGYGLLWVLPVAAVLNFFTVNRYFSVLFSESESRLKPTGARLQTILSVLRISTFLVFCITASTLILAAAGYVFNETFVRWFPNLLFSVCLLVFILAANIIGSRFSRLIQNFSIILFSGSMLLLVAVGLFSIDKPLFGNIETPGILTFETRSVFMLFLIFMAAELSVYIAKQNENPPSGPAFIAVAFTAAFAVFWLWSIISIASTPSQALAESTGPQYLAAHFIAGDNGRRIMSVAILAGGFAGVNMLLLGTGGVLNTLISPAVTKLRLPGRITDTKTFMVILSLLILAMLLGGMAGKEITFTLKRCAFYIWLITYAGFNLHHLRHQAASASSINSSAIAGITASAIYIAAFIVLVATDQRLKEVILFIR